MFPIFSTYNTNILLYFKLVNISSYINNSFVENQKFVSCPTNCQSLSNKIIKYVNHNVEFVIGHFVHIVILFCCIWIFAKK